MFVYIPISGNAGITIYPTIGIYPAIGPCPDIRVYPDFPMPGYVPISVYNMKSKYIPVSCYEYSYPDVCVNHNI